MKIPYECTTCGYSGEATVPDKQIAVDLPMWLERVVIKRLVIHHQSASPECNEQSFTFEFHSSGRDDPR
jgi:hypothetical protein